MRHSVTQLFVDNDGIFCSSERCDPCIVSGIFYEEPVLEGRDDYEVRIEQTFQKLIKCSKLAGYNILREALRLREDQPDPTFDQLALIAKDCNYTDFRVKRRIIDQFRQGVIVNSRERI